nr:MAG TPA: hypothetical protein [Caudoviricetes sp.]
MHLVIEIEHCVLSFCHIIMAKSILTMSILCVLSPIYYISIK